MRLVLIGSGNVATHLGIALLKGGHSIEQVWSRNADHATVLAKRLNAKPTDKLHELIQEADFYIIAVVDEAIPGVLAQIPPTSACILHTSGTTDMLVMASSAKRYGVLYPVQTFSKEKDLDLSLTPILIEASDQEALASIEQLASSFSTKVQHCDSKQRRAIHIAGVFSCNFTNSLYAIAQNLLTETNLDFDLIRPLIKETAEKVMHHLPNQVQTGPAFRGDKTTLDRHLAHLKDHPHWLEVYKLLSLTIENNKNELNKI